MSDVIRLTQEFYQERRAAVPPNLSQDIAEAHEVGWNAESQVRGFEVAADLPWIHWGDIENVLDVGCGYGKFAEFLIHTKKYKGKYWGIDIVPEYIEKAIHRYGSQLQSSFFVGDFLEQDWDARGFDVIVSLGSLGVNQDYPAPSGQKSGEYARKQISSIAELSSSAISIYFPNADNLELSQRKPRMAYYKRSEMEVALLAACGKRCEDITFISFPDPNNVKTMARVKLSD